MNIRRAARRARTSTSVSTRRSSRERLRERVDEIFDALFFVDVNADVLHHAATIGPELLRTGDAIHLATALALEDPDVEFVTYDARLAQAAAQIGLRLVQPGARAKAPTMPSGSR